MRRISLKALATILCAMVLCSAVAQASEIVLVGQVCPMTVYEETTADEGTETEITQFRLLGTVGDDFAAILLEDTLGYVTVEELKEKIPMLDIASLPGVSDWKMLSRGNISDATREVQQFLIDNGYLDDTADGSYGRMTETAVMAYQKDMRLPETGKCGVATRLCMLGNTEETLEFPYPPVYTAEEKFAAIWGKTDTDLERYVPAEYLFTYDVYDGTGCIDPHIKIGGIEDDSKDVDRIAVDVSVGIYVARNDLGRVDLTPALYIRSTGANRLYVRTVQLRSGNEVREIKKLASDGEIEGTTLTETTVIPIDADTAAFLAQADNTDTTMRINGQSRTLDIALNDSIETLNTFLNR